MRDDVTQLLNDVQQGDSQAAAQLLPLVYSQLRALAANYLAHESAGHTLQPTALVHEAYLRLTGNQEMDWSHRGHFFAAAAEAMRRLLIDHARHKHRLKRGGDRQRVALDLDSLATPTEDLPRLDEALSRLAIVDPRKAEVVKLRFFVGLSMSEIARALKISLATVERDWTFARTWLFAELTDEHSAATQDTE